MNGTWYPPYVLKSGRWYSLGAPVSATNKTDHHDITEILLKVALNTIKQTKPKRTKRFLNKCNGNKYNFSAVQKFIVHTVII
jgi:hypothetical protein